MNKAKQFLIDNSFEFSEAVDNGYGIIMDEDEILEWMQKYAESEVKNLALPQVIGWVALSESEPENEGTYYVYPSKYSHTAYYNKYGKWAGKWTRDDENGYEYEVLISHWKIIEPPCL